MSRFSIGVVIKIPLSLPWEEGIAKAKGGATGIRSRLR